MNHAVILLGSNAGDLPVNLKFAMNLISEKAGNIIKTSLVYKTEPWGKKDQPDFLNQVLEIETHLMAKPLLNSLLEIEKLMGRERIEKWAQRIIDLDILYFNNDIINEPGLSVPHPFLQERRFVLVPLSEILRDMIHPVLNKTNIQLLNELNDSMKVRAFEPHMEKEPRDFLAE